jgi:hypothetical protein
MNYPEAISALVEGPNCMDILRADVKWLPKKERDHQSYENYHDCKIASLFSVDYPVKASSETINAVLWNTHGLIQTMRPEFSFEDLPFVRYKTGGGGDINYGILLKSRLNKEEADKTIKFFRDIISPLNYRPDGKYKFGGELPGPPGSNVTVFNFNPWIESYYPETMDAKKIACSCR